MAMLRLPAFFCAAVLALSVTGLPALSQEGGIGETASVVKVVTGVLGDKQRKLVAKDPVFSNELIQTGPDSASQLKFLDDTVLTIGPESEVVLDEFVFDAEPEKQKAVINASVGVLRFVTGKLSYKIKTPTATIGVRGTVFTVVVLAGGTVEAFVEEGELIITVTLPDGSQREISLPAGTAIILEPGQPPVVVGTPSIDGQSLVAEMDAILIIVDGSIIADPVLEQALLEGLGAAVELRESHQCAC